MDNASAKRITDELNQVAELLASLKNSPVLQNATGIPLMQDIQKAIDKTAATQSLFSTLVNKGLYSRLPGLIEIFYGLAIASGLQFVSTFIFVPGKDDYAINSGMWWVMLWAVGVSILASISDWMGYAQESEVYTKPVQVIFDLLFPMCLYFLFAAAFRFEAFVSAVAAYSLVAIFYFILARPKGEKALAYAVLLLTCITYLYCHFKSDGANCLNPFMGWCTGLIITICLIINLRIRYKQLKATI